MSDRIKKKRLDGRIIHKKGKANKAVRSPLFSEGAEATNFQGK
jgi:hypothetical protein